MNVLLLRGTPSPKRIRGTFLRHQPTRRTCFYAAAVPVHHRDLLPPARLAAGPFEGYEFDAAPMPPPPSWPEVHRSRPKVPSGMRMQRLAYQPGYESELRKAPTKTPSTPRIRLSAALLPGRRSP